MRRLVPILFLAVGCSRELSNEQLIEKSLEAARQGPQLLRAQHDGPGVATGSAGPARFADQVHAAFDAEAAFATTRFADGFYRAPANDGYEAVLDHVIQRLSDAGFAAPAAGADASKLRLDVVVTPRTTPAWTPLSARLVTLGADGREQVLHAFDEPAGADRTMLPVNAPSADVEGDLVVALDRVVAGSVLLVDGPLGRALLADAGQRGAVLVLSSDLGEVNVDPERGGERHLDAIAFRGVSAGTTLAVAQVSPRVGTGLRTALERDGRVRVRFTSRVKFDERPLRTVVATIVGATRPDECVATAAHVQEPGACDNASGVGSMVEAARVAARLIQSGEVPRPARSVCFVFGDEMIQSHVFLEREPPADGFAPKCVAAIAADMTGESAAVTGALALLERSPDPGALRALPPDRHTAWLGSKSTGATAQRRDLVPDGLAVVVRCALIDVGGLRADWRTSEHPHEGGSDHVVFQSRGVPAVLVWHFPDFAYHSSLDRLSHVDPEEMRRSGSAILSALLALADPRPADLDRYLKSLRAELDVRVAAADAAGDAQLAADWNAWGRGARAWLRSLCLNAPFPARAPIPENP